MVDINLDSWPASLHWNEGLFALLLGQLPTMTCYNILLKAKKGIEVLNLWTNGRVLGEIL
jgi:hypothetical protein